MSIPSSISGLQLWMDSSDNSTLTLAGTTVTGWTDKSGNGNNPTSITGSPSIATQNGNQYMNFSSSQVFGSMSITTTTLSIFSVLSIASAAPSGTFPRIVSLSAPGQLDYSSQAYGGLYVFQNTRNITAYRNALAAQGSNSSSTPILGASIFNGSNGAVYVNGTAGASGSSTGNFGISTYTIGNQAGGGAGLSGAIGEVLVYNTALTTSERQSIEGYLMWKWGINALLPVAHPYYSVNPNGPTNLVATVTSTTASIAFTPPTGTIANYQYSTNNGSTYTAFSPAQATSPVLISGLTNNTTYSIRLKAVDSNNNVSIGAGSVTAITTASTPAAPTSVVATAGFLSISLAFTPPAGTISNYQYSLNGGSAVVLSPVQITSPIVISGILVTSYTITLQAINGNGAGAASSSVSATVIGNIPSSISGLRLWMDSSDNSTLTLSGSTVTGWTDKSGNSNNPTRIAGSPSIATQNGNQYMNFSSSEVFGSVSITTTTLSIFSVLSIASAAPSGVFPRIVSLSAPGQLDYSSQSYGGLYVFQNTRNITAYRNALTAQGSNSSSTPILGASIFDASNGTVYVNGTAGASGSSTGNFGISTYTLGNQTGGGAALAGAIGEVLIYNTALVLSQRQLIEGHLAWKWGINALLPVAHPYYSVNPNVPSSLVATVTSTTASISFSPPPGTITNYQYSTNNGSTFTAFSPVQATSPVLISGLSTNTTYSIQLRGVDFNGAATGASTSVTATTTPAAPTSLVATAGYLSISLAFTPPAGTISNYQYSLNGGSYVAVSPAQTTSPIVISGLSATSYTITLKAVNGNGAGAASSSVSATPSSSILWNISGLQIWYDGSDPNNTGTAPANGTAITTWKNKAPTGATYDAVAGNSFGFANNAATYNSTYRALNFNNASYSTGGYTGNPTAETAFIVFNNPSPTSFNWNLFGGTLGSRCYTCGYSGSTGTNAIGVLANEVAWRAGTPAGSYVSNTTGIGTFKIASGTAYAALYGYNSNTFYTGTASFTAGSTTWLGIDTTVSSYTYNGYAMEIIVYNTALSASDIVSVQNYLYQKWIAPAANASISSGMLLWCDVADASTLTYGANRTAGSSSYATVTGVRDKSGGSRNLTISPSTTAPIYIPSLSPTTIADMTSYSAFLNYSNFFNIAKTFLKPTLAFRGRQTSALDSLQATIGLSSAPFAFFGVFADVNDGCLFGTTDNSSVFINYSNVYDVNYLPSNTIDQRNVAKSNYGMVLKCLYVTSGTLYQQINGTARGSTSFTNFSLSNFRFNGRTNGETTEGFISEVLVYNRAMTSGEVEAITGYLATKWGIQSQLPTSHPYYSTAFTGTITTSGGSSGATISGSSIPDTRGKLRVLGTTIGMNGTKLY